MLNGYTLEVILSLFAMAWGIWLLAPFDTFGTSITFSTMATLAPEEAWGLAMFGLGLMWIGALKFRVYHARRLSSLISTMLWCFISVMFWIANLSSTASATYPIIALACGLAHIRMRRGPDDTQ